jgi:hypothetical protein
MFAGGSRKATWRSSGPARCRRADVSGKAAGFSVAARLGKARARIERKGVIRVAPGPGGSCQGGQPRLLVRRLRGWLRTQLPESGATKSIAVSIVAGWPLA